jgi:hypothetical protein
LRDVDFSREKKRERGRASLEAGLWIASRTPLTHRNIKRNMSVVGPLVAADSESNLRTFRLVGTPRAASAGFDEMSPALVGNLRVAASAASARSPCAFGDNTAPPGSRHRRCAPELA